ncbi:MAG: sel1 repeat family protein [Gammaproteobacteria bacterium]|nr:sel1 repeat family protein [Gammaproteobacteria bacterium]
MRRNHKLLNQREMKRPDYLNHALSMWFRACALITLSWFFSFQASAAQHAPREIVSNDMTIASELSRHSLTNYLHQEGLTDYENGNYSSSLSIFRTLASLNHTAAQYYLANMYFNGYGVTHDAAQAMLWYERAAELGHIQSQYNMGVAYAKGIGIGSDISQAIYWWRRAALSGNTDAQFNLGLVYSKGFGINKDLTTAARWWHKAATQGDAAAQFNLGTLYANGDGVGQNLELAIELWQQSAQQGFSHAVDALKSLSLYQFLGNNQKK